jgi:hypothetical protein
MVFFEAERNYRAVFGQECYNNQGIQIPELFGQAVFTLSGGLPWQQKYRYPPGGKRACPS